jgi:hypothetical protein
MFSNKLNSSNDLPQPNIKGEGCSDMDCNSYRHKIEVRSWIFRKIFLVRPNHLFKIKKYQKIKR